MPSRDAACSCGQLRLTVEGDPVRISMCHCLACQRRTGSAFGIQARFPVAQVRIDGRSSDFVRTSDEGGEARTFHFCPDCGATVFYTTSSSPDLDRRPDRRLRGSDLPGADRLGLGGTSASVAGAAGGDGALRLTCARFGQACGTG